MKPRVLWVLTGVVALTFIVTGASKIFAVPPSPENFARWGFSMNFMRLIGAVEVLGALALVLPRTSFLAALLLSANMLGALRTGIAFREPLHIVLPAVLLILLGLIAWARRATVRSPR
jgi:putative oxidoreductase